MPRSADCCCCCWGEAKRADEWAEEAPERRELLSEPVIMELGMDTEPMGLDGGEEEADEESEELEFVSIAEESSSISRERVRRVAGVGRLGVTAIVLAAAALAAALACAAAAA